MFVDYLFLFLKICKIFFDKDILWVYVWLITDEKLSKKN